MPLEVCRNILNLGQLIVHTGCDSRMCRYRLFQPNFFWEDLTTKFQDFRSFRDAP